MSNSNELFAAALGVACPWSVRDVTFDAGKRLLVIGIDFAKGSKLPVPRRRRIASRPRHGAEALPASELLPA